MSSTSDRHRAHPAHRALDRRTVAAVQEKIIEKRGRGVFSRLANAKNDKEMIAAWKLDLIRILQVFNVRSSGSVRLSLTVSSQTELMINTNVIVSDIRRDMLAGQGSTQSR